jgi:putative Holliday junction resolvase
MSNNGTHVCGRLLGIDHGLARIGIAVSDSTGLVARELTIIHRTSKNSDFARLKQIAEEQAVCALVIGIPQDVVRAEQGLYSQADKVRNWVSHLRDAITLPVIFWDETLTTVEAAELARQQKRKRDAAIDDLAARVMLQSYLDALRDGLADTPESEKG